MNKLETNALRIAELMGYKKIEPHSYQKAERCWFKYQIELMYSSYDYLMPIVFECNKSDVDYPITMNPYQVKAYPGDGMDIYGYNTEPEFIESIQECIIKYLELKHG